MLRNLSVLVLAFWAGLSVASAEPQFPPGQRVGLEPLKGMTPMVRGPGFEDVDRKAKIAVLDLPMSAYEEIQRSLFGPNPGMTVEKRESFPFENGIGFLLTARATTDGAPVRRWYLLATGATPADDLVAFINVEVPDSAREVYTEAMVRAALASVTFRAPPIGEQLALLPFKLEALAGFRVMKAIPSGGVILTDGPTDDIMQQPYAIISVGGGAPNEPDQRGAFSRQMLSSAPLRDLNITSGESMRIGGRPGNEIRATASDLRGNPVTLVQWVRFSGTAYIRVIGVGRREDWDKLFPRFREIRDGVEAK